MKPIPLSRSFNNVQTDFQWRQRCQKEEMQLLDSFAGPKALQIDTIVQQRNKQRFYAKNGARIMQIKPKEEPITVDKQLDTQSLAKISQQNQSNATPSVAAMSSVSKSQSSRVSYNSKSTTMSTRDRLAKVEKELEEERRRRNEAEQIIAFLRSTG